MAGFLDFLQQKPEQFAIIADMLGKGFAPDNPFAGIGTAVGQSSLAAQAKQQQQAQLAQLLGGGQPQAPVGQAQPQNLLGGLDLGTLTDATQPGPTSLTIKAQPDGSQVSTTTGTVTAPAAVGAPVAGQPQGVNLTDLLPFSDALAGGQVDLTGLTPAMISQIAGDDFKVAQLKRLVAGDIAGSALAQQKQKTAQQKLAMTAKLNDSLIKHRGLLDQKVEQELTLNAAKAPAEIAQAKATLKKTEADILTSAEALEKSELANKAEQRRQELTAALGGDVDVEDLSLQQQVEILGATEAQRLAVSRTTLEQKRSLADRAAETKDVTAAYKALAKIDDDDATVESNIAALSEWNAKSPDTANIGYYYSSEDPWGFEGPGVKTVELPKGMSMGWLRTQAETQGVAIEDILKQLDDELRGE